MTAGAGAGEAGPPVSGDFSRAEIVTAAELTGPERKTVTMLEEEIERRSTLRLAEARPRAAASDAPLIVMATAEQLGGLALGDDSTAPTPPPQPESFAVRTGRAAGRSAIWVVGRDARGMLFGTGYLLRQLTLLPGTVSLAGPLDAASAPRLRWRGHQLGYRPKTNSYDGWDVADWERYVRDLVIFGANAIELVPPRSDDIPDSPHFPLPPLRMMRAMSQLAADYGIECWIWYPAIDRKYGDPAIRRRAVEEWKTVFAALPRIDAVFVPGGDPGGTPPGLLMDLVREQTDVLHRFHPAAGMWVSPQGFSASWLKEWLAVVQRRPAWLTGVVYGPWTRMSLPELRAAVPATYPLRLYPDITHTFLSQYPVPEWDAALASTLGREPIAPRPRAMARILRGQVAAADGAISYSEGCNDDVNKAVWSALAWNPAADIETVLREYARYYVSPAIEKDFARGLEALEENWRGPLRTNGGVDATLHRFQGLERDATPRLLHNWRFQQALYRAYFDAYVRRRLLRESGQEQRVLALLGGAGRSGAAAALQAAKQALAEPPNDPVLAAWRTRIFQLAEALFQSIDMQLSVPLYRAEAVPRGANLDTVDLPLTDRAWLGDRLAEIERLPDGSAQVAALQGVASWKDPGPGGFYDNLGAPTEEPHLVRDSAADDPEYRTHPLVTHTVRTGRRFENWRADWWKRVSAFYGSGVELRYEGLDPAARYRVRVVYVPTFTPARIRLIANDRFEVHPYLDPGNTEKGGSPRPREFAVPAGATQGGVLRLRWTADPDAGDNVGFGQIAEVWLIRTPALP